MARESSLVARPSRRLRADLPESTDSWISLATRPAILLLAAGFVLLGGAALELGPIESKIGLSLSEPLGPFGRLFGYWEPSVWPGTVALGQAWAFFEEKGPTQNAVRWPAALATVVIGLFLSRRVRILFQPRAGLFAGLCWFGSIAAMDRSAGAGLDYLAGLGTYLALDRMIARGAGGLTGVLAATAFLFGGWPPLAVLTLSMIVLGRSEMRWSWRMTIPVVTAVAGWSGWAMAASWSSSPVEAWAAALALPLTQPSAWGLGITVLSLGLPWTPFALLTASRAIRSGWNPDGNATVTAWLKVVGACLIGGTVIPGLASSCLIPALAGLAIASAACWDRLWSAKDDLPATSRRRALGLTLIIAAGWLLPALLWGGYVAFAVAYYRVIMIAVAATSVVGFALAIHAAMKSEVRWALAAMMVVAIGLKLGHWGFYVPESNYRFGQGPWGRAIGQWVPRRFPIYITHSWPTDLAFATGHRVLQVAHPSLLHYQPGGKAKFVLLLESEFEHWPSDAPKLIEVARFRHEWESTRILARTEGTNPLETPIRDQVVSDE